MSAKRINSKSKHVFHNLNSKSKEDEGEGIPNFPPSVSFIFDENGNIVKEYEFTWAQKIFITLDNPTSSRFGKIVAYMMLFTIVLSSLVFVVASDPSLHERPDSCKDPACENDVDLCPNSVICAPKPPVTLFYIEAVCVFIFAIEYCLRLITIWFVPPRFAGVSSTWENKRDSDYPPLKVFLLYVVKIMNIIDLIAILPFFIELFIGAGSSLSIVRILRMGRMLRLFKSSKYHQSLDIFVVTFSRSKASLKVLFAMNFMLAVIFAALVYTFEKGNFTVNELYPNGAYLRPTLLGNDEEESPFVSIWTALYWSIVTGSTVGYGELYPTTSSGRIVASMWIYSSIFVIALPISVLGGNFLGCLEEKAERKREEKQLRKSVFMIKRNSALSQEENDDSDSGLEMSSSNLEQVEVGQDSKGESGTACLPQDSSIANNIDDEKLHINSMTDVDHSSSTNDSSPTSMKPNPSTPPSKANDTSPPLKTHTRVSDQEVGRNDIALLNHKIDLLMSSFEALRTDNERLRELLLKQQLSSNKTDSDIDVHIN